MPLPGIVKKLLGLPALYLCSPRPMARSGLRLQPSGGWICTASFTIHRDSWQARVILPSGVEQSSLSTELDSTLKSPGRLESSALCVRESEELSELLWLPMSQHWLSVSSNLGLPLQMVVCPWSSPGDSRGAVCQFPLPFVLPWRLRGLLPIPGSCPPFRCDHTEGAGIVVPGGPCPICSCWRFLLWWPGLPQTPEPPGGVVLFLTSLGIQHIYQSNWYPALSEGVGVWDSITIEGIRRGFDISADARVCPSVECVPKQLCPSQSQVLSGSQFVNHPRCSPLYSVQCCPNTASLISKPPLYMAASVQ